MQLNLDQIFRLIEIHKYLVLLPFAIIEGPIVTVIAGFLASLGVLNFFLVWLVVIIGDILGDTLYYMLGRYGGRRIIGRWGKYIRIPVEQIKNIEKHFEVNGFTTVVVGKLAFGLETVTLVSAGLAKLPYLRRFLLYVLLPSLPKTLLLTLIGFYFGSAYVRIEQYLDNAAMAIILVAILALVFFFLYRYLIGKLVKKVE